MWSKSLFRKDSPTVKPSESQREPINHSSCLSDSIMGSKMTEQEQVTKIDDEIPEFSGVDSAVNSYVADNNRPVSYTHLTLPTILLV